MEVRAPSIKPTQELTPGELFYLQGVGEGVLCIAARPENAAGTDLRLVPLHYPQSPQSLYVPLYESHYRGTAVVVNNATAEVDLSSGGSITPGVIWSDGSSLFLPLIGGGHGLRTGLMNLKSGAILDRVPNLVSFGRWRIVDIDDNDTVIWTSGGNTGE